MTRKEFLKQMYELRNLEPIYDFRDSFLGHRYKPHITYPDYPLADKDLSLKDYYHECQLIDKQKVMIELHNRGVWFQLVRNPLITALIKKYEQERSWWQWFIDRVLLNRYGKRLTGETTHLFKFPEYDKTLPSYLILMEYARRERRLRDYQPDFDDNVDENSEGHWVYKGGYDFYIGWNGIKADSEYRQYKTKPKWEDFYKPDPLTRVCGDYWVKVEMDNQRYEFRQLCDEIEHYNEDVWKHNQKLFENKIVWPRILALREECDRKVAEARAEEDKEQGYPQ